MASPVVESRIEPHKKAHFSLHLSDRIRNSDDAADEYSSVKYNHKPTQTGESRSTTLQAPSSAGACSLRIDDTNEDGEQDVYTFTGQKTQPKKSYVLIFDPSTQQATLEPLSSSYTFNIATRNGKDISSQHAKIYPKKLKDEKQDKDDEDDLFGEVAADDGDPDPDNPYDFRHFLSKEKEKRGDESDYRYASSPEHRTGPGSAVHTPQLGGRAPAATAQARKPAVTAPPKKRKPAAANPMVKPKKAQPTPAVRLQRTATDTTPKPKAKSTAPPASKIKSAEIIHSSDESDGEIPSSPAHHSPPPEQSHHHDQDEDDAEAESDDDGGLEIEVPDARPPRRNKGALAALGLGQNLGAGYRRSPSNGPISLASAANSDVEGSPNPHARNRNTQDEIDFGDLGGDDAEGEDDDEEDDEDDDNEYNDRDIEPVDISRPVQQERKPSMVAEIPADDDEDDLEELMRRGLEGGDSSEESEEE